MPFPHLVFTFPDLEPSTIATVAETSCIRPNASLWHRHRQCCLEQRHRYLVPRVRLTHRPAAGACSDNAASSLKPLSRKKITAMPALHSLLRVLSSPKMTTLSRILFGRVRRGLPRLLDSAATSTLHRN